MIRFNSLFVSPLLLLVSVATACDDKATSEDLGSTGDVSNSENASSAAASSSGGNTSAQASTTTRPPSSGQGDDSGEEDEDTEEQTAESTTGRPSWSGARDGGLPPRPGRGDGGVTFPGRPDAEDAGDAGRRRPTNDGGRPSWGGEADGGAFTRPEFDRDGGGAFEGSDDASFGPGQFGQ
jgi:hypothetical protein